jgi:hypothetical protein
VISREPLSSSARAFDDPLLTQMDFASISDISMAVPSVATHNRWPNGFDLNQQAPQEDPPTVSRPAQENGLPGTGMLNPVANGSAERNEGRAAQSGAQSGSGSGSTHVIDLISRMLYFASRGSVEEMQEMLRDGAGEGTTILLRGHFSSVSC